MRIKQDQRGISNVIVFVLGLVIIVVIVSNVFLWNYEMNQLDWEKMQEDINIVNVTRGIQTWSYNPSGYALDGTSLVSGGVSDLTLDDGVYMTFRSYYTGTDTSDFVDNNTSNVDSSADKGTHSNFTAQQYGPDSTYDVLQEQDTGEANATFGKTDVGASIWGFTGYLVASRYQCGQDGMVTKITLYLTGCASGRYARVAIYSDYNGAPDSLLSESNEQEVASDGWHDFTGFNVPVSVNTYYWLAFQISTNNLNWHYDSGLTNQHAYRSYTYGSFPSSFGSQGYAALAQSVYATYISANYELDLEVQWTNVDFDETNEELCIYGGTMGTEDIRVDVWYSSTWQNLFTDLSTGWNNVSVSSYLDSSTFTIRFNGGNEIGDTTEDEWNIDVTLLHVWSYGYTVEVEFTGSSNTEDWTRLNWTINSAWTIGSVSVTLQLYNYTLEGYPTSGNGYVVYTSDSTPNIDETKSQTITINPTHFRNATGYWKMKVKGVKATDTQFNFKADWIEFKVVKVGETLFTFENEGSLTSRLVSLWVINSTHHRPYDIDLIINSGQTLNYTRADISLPSGEYIVKVVTERGNTATYPGS